MTITTTAMEAIKIKEGWPVRYIDQEVSVQVDGKKRPIEATTFIVQADHRLEHDVPVTARYRNLILMGAEAAGLNPLPRHPGKGR